ncbi:hypothetical protein AAFF_G00375460 [Aldrovandia affinis]|uniref:Uncharacterized protein n=1 Tax=Aldrovandia affinis TaxID=143900 RepID=A0AAD7SGC5_9TELE|nr:hypothetical protein AAFF_G00375460 [Aldrovandia affinis]
MAARHWPTVGDAIGELRYQFHSCRAVHCAAGALAELHGAWQGGATADSNPLTGGEERKRINPSLRGLCLAWHCDGLLNRRAGPQKRQLTAARGMVWDAETIPRSGGQQCSAT